MHILDEGQPCSFLDVVVTVGLAKSAHFSYCDSNSNKFPLFQHHVVQMS